MDSDDLSGQSVEMLVDVTGAHPDSARRWKRLRQTPKHRAAHIALGLQGELGAIIKQGKIWTPEGQPVLPGELRAIPYRSELIDELKRQLAQPQQWVLFQSTPD